jgi:hypothetical protein
MKNLSRNEDTLKENSEIIKKLLEPEEGDILMLNSISSRPTNGKLEGKETPRVTINFGEVSRARLCDLNSTRSQHYLHLEFAFQFFKTFKFCFHFF